MSECPPCPVEARMTAAERQAGELSQRLKSAEDELSNGRVAFAEMRGEIRALTVALTTLVVELRAEKAARPSTLDKLGDALIHWCVPLIGGALLWAIMQSQMAKAAP